MALSFKYLLEIVESKTLFYPVDEGRKMGGFRWNGPHFPVFVRYVSHLQYSYYNHERFSDLLRRAEESAYLCCQTGNFLRGYISSLKFLVMMDHFLPELREFFTVPRSPPQLLFDTTTRRNELVAVFIDFLVEAFEAVLGHKYLSRSITSRINDLLEDLKFLLFILGDTPFRCTQVEETENILAEIESIANQTGLFLHSFFFTAKLIKEHKIVAAISDLLPKFKMTREKIKQHLPSFTTPTGDMQRVRMAPPFKYLLEIVESKTLILGLDLVRKMGGFRWKGPHFSVFLRYVSNLQFYCNHDRFSDLLTSVEESAYLYCKNKNFLGWLINLVKFSETMKSFLPELRQFFTIPMPHQLLSDTTPKRNEIVAAFIDFLVEAFEQISRQKHSLIFMYYDQIPDLNQIPDLMDELKFILFILGDTPFRGTEVEETENILADIESIANQAGLFLHSFFFTTDHIKDPEILASLSDLLPKFKMMKQKIEKHCIAFSNLPSVTTPNTGLVSVFVVDSVLDYLNHLINNEACLIAEVKDQITTLREGLQLSRSFLGDIELKQDEDLIKQAIQIQDLAYEVEYILTWFVTRKVPVWYMTLRLSHFIQKNKLITTAILETKLNYGINSSQVVDGRRQVSSHVSNSIQIDEEMIVGLDDETMKIESHLVRGPDNQQMISITGMPGLGKTTLAKKLYYHPSVVNHFDQRLWCVVSQTYQRSRLLRDILSSIPDLKKDKFLEKEREDSELGEYLYKSLKRRRYLIVMDDIWDIQAWNDVKIYFPKDNTRSRVLFTTRNGHLASEVSSDAIVEELHLKSANQCWDLLRHKVFQKSICPPELEHTGKQIAASCKGLPLIVVGIGAVLANMEKNECSWQQVLESLTSYIFKDQDILELSYKHLPIRLKPCFLYFSAFEEDREIPVKKLLSLWISEGFIPANKDKRLEEIAEEYLIELINRNMVQVAKRRSDKGVKACKVHDLMHDMALRIAEKEKFLKIMKDGFSLYEEPHRLCNHSHPRDIKSTRFGLHIRSLLGISMSSFNESCLRLIRVWQCKDRDDHIYGLHTPLVQLRYLEIPYIWFQMPREIENLEFLIVTEQTIINRDFSSVPKLRHLVFKNFSYARVRKDVKLSQHYCLETLSGVAFYNSFDQRILKCFPNLRRLKCWYRDSSNHCADVSILTRLESLSMRVDSSKVKFRSNNFPTSIRKLSLDGGYGIMSSIGKLPNLEILKLVSLKFKGQNWETNEDEFQKLKFLELRYLELKNWITSEDHFPMLERLVLENCKHLKGIPLELGSIPTLQMIEVHSCGKSVEESALTTNDRFSRALHRTTLHHNITQWKTVPTLAHSPSLSPIHPTTIDRASGVSIEAS